MTETDVNWTAITGSTGGIGSEIVKIHAARGDALLMLNRSAKKAEAQRDDLLSAHPGLTIKLITVNLMDRRNISNAIKEINELPGRIDILYNNSGILTAQKVLSPQGLESQFEVHAVAPYQLIKGLRSKMARGADDTPAMVVNFSSSAISPLKVLELDNLSNPDKVGGLMSTYAQTKLAATAMAPAMSDALAVDNILIRAIDPGATKSAMTTGGNDAMPTVIAWLAPLLFRPADKQAAKVVSAAAPDAFGGRTGIYVANLKEKKLPAPAQDPDTQRALIALLDGLTEG
ncbi:MAG: SDR family NAD(P)-dependent oxidoreductase [Pseudomonadota bacterium]